MTATATASPAARTQSTRLFAPERLEPGGRTLEDSVLAAWRELRQRGTAACLVCGAKLEGDGACTSCGAELS